MGRRLLGTFEITEYEANRKYGFKSLSGPLHSQTLYTFEIAGGSTKINVSMQASAVDSSHISEGNLEKQLRKQLKENLTLLKGILEKNKTGQHIVRRVFHVPGLLWFAESQVHGE
jgi:hypothetical protein